MNRPAYMEVETVQVMIAARDLEYQEKRARAEAALASYRAARAKRHHKRAGILRPFKRLWRAFLRQEEKARTGFIMAFYPEATGADLARANFYKELLFWFVVALVSAPLAAGLAAIL